MYKLQPLDIGIMKNFKVLFIADKALDNCDALNIDL